MGYNITRTDSEDIRITEAVERYASDKHPEDYTLDRCVVCGRDTSNWGHTRNRHLCRWHAAYVQAHLPNLQTRLRQLPTDPALLVQVVEEYINREREPREGGLCLYPTCSNRGRFTRTLCRQHATMFKEATPLLKMKNRKRGVPTEYKMSAQERAEWESLL